MKVWWSHTGFEGLDREGQAYSCAVVAGSSRLLARSCRGAQPVITASRMWLHGSRTLQPPPFFFLSHSHPSVHSQWVLGLKEGPSCVESLHVRTVICSSCPVFKRREVESGLHVCPFCCDGVVRASFAVCSASCEMFLLGVLEKGRLNGDGKPGGAAGIWTPALYLTWSLSLSLWSLQTLSPPTSWWTRVARSNCATLVWVASSSTPWPTPSLEHGRTCRWVTRPLPSPTPSPSRSKPCAGAQDSSMWRRGSCCQVLAHSSWPPAGCGAPP